MGRGKGKRNGEREGKTERGTLVFVAVHAVCGRLRVREGWARHFCFGEFGS
jgi:hypothetical protein